MTHMAARYDTVLFDMDGTLLYTLDDLGASVNYALGRAGLPLASADEVRLAAGYGSIVLVEMLTHHELATDSPKFKQVFSDFNEHYEAHRDDTTRPYDGVMELLAALKERGVKMAVVSNKIARDTEALRQKWFADYISVAVGRTDDVPPKPAPDMALAALAALGSSADRALYVGDSEPDAQVAKSSGCTGVSVTWGFRTRETLEAQKPAHIIDAPSALLPIVDAAG